MKGILTTKENPYIISITAEWGDFRWNGTLRSCLQALTFDQFLGSPTNVLG